MGDSRVSLGKGLRRSVIAAGICACAVAQVGGWAQAPAASLGKQTTMLAEPPAPLLPAMLGKLKRVAAGDAGDGLGQVAAADAPVLKEDGLKRFARSEYADGAQRVDVTVYRFADASGAVSAYDYFRRPGARPEKLGDDAVRNGDDLLMRSGVNVVQETYKGESALLAPLTHELIDHLPKVGGAAGIMPLLPTLLPRSGLDPDSVKYALGPAGYQAMGGVLPADAVGFDKSAETVTAKYKNGGVLTLLLYPTPQIAGDHDRAIGAQIPQPAAGKPGAMKLRREGPMLVMTTGSWTAAAAQKMVDGVHLHQEVSFDKPMPLEFHAEVQKTYSLLESIVIFCAFSAVAMVVLALFFGGGRAAIRVMQGKPAATEPEFLHIDLSGPGGKRLRGPEA